MGNKSFCDPFFRGARELYLFITVFFLGPSCTGRFFHSPGCKSMFFSQKKPPNQSCREQYTVHTSGM